MSIVKKDISIPVEGGQPIKKIELTIDNGDLQALNQIIEKYNFKDDEAALRFALYVLLRSENNTVSVEEGGKKVNLVPSEKLIKPKQEHATEK